MSLLFLTLASLAEGQVIDNAKLRFDGFYQTKAEIDKHNNDTTYYYLRFYSTGKVISVSSDGTPDDLKTWFNLDKEDISAGSYKITGNKLYFSTVAKDGGTVVYYGKIKNRYRLVLRSISLINGRQTREKYHFVIVPNLN